MCSMRYVNSLNYQLIDSHLKPHAVRSLGDLLLWPVFLSVPSRTLQMRVREDSPVSPVESSVLALPCTNGGTALVHPDGWAIHITPVMGEGPMFLLFFYIFTSHWIHSFIEKGSSESHLLCSCTQFGKAAVLNTVISSSRTLPNSWAVEWSQPCIILWGNNCCAPVCSRIIVLQ